jgi:hypothetical protein
MPPVAAEDVPVPGDHDGLAEPESLDALGQVSDLGIVGPDPAIEQVVLRGGTDTAERKSN